ncbi:MAG: hypothetical protein F9K44_11320 [Hyphomicrobiaceae bacterium]|nr:MAG: hypothetical protein F9K44_11320 [Hyphomicrobiaceae bacterium]
MRAALPVLAGLIVLNVVPSGPAVAAEPPVARVLTALGADRPDVRACIESAIAVSSRAREEIERLDKVLAWIERAVGEPRRRLAKMGITDAAADPELALAKARSDRFVDIVETFNHERRLDEKLLRETTDGALGPAHIVTYARVRRALGRGHDPRKVFCGS